MPQTAHVIIPLAAPKAYTYLVPDEMAGVIRIGMRVEVQFGRNKVYSGIVRALSTQDSIERLKPILSILDEAPVVHESNIEFWEWISSYYVCTSGEVMLAALPAALRMSSETVIVINPSKEAIPDSISDAAYLIAEALQIQNRLTIEEARRILNVKSVMPVFHELIREDFAFLEEEVQEKYKPKIKQYVRLSAAYRSEESYTLLFEKCERSEKQTRALLAYFQLIRSEGEISKEQLIKASDTDHATLKAMESKGLILLYDKQVSRLSEEDVNNPELQPLSDYQQRAMTQIEEGFDQQKPVLLRGITGSGKTRIYQELIQKVLQSGGQVLYLLPEIGLTAQMQQRLSTLYGPSLLVYHSRLNANSRVEIWKKIYAGHPLVVGARSALLLPFKKLDLIIVDEEHDPSYKQQDPAPRYQGKDAALYLAKQTGARIILGSATPSVESIYLAKTGKFQYVEMTQRFGDAVLPKLHLVDMVEARRKNKVTSIFSVELLEAIENTLNSGEKVILFQNRRGFSPILECELCNWTAECIHCDVTLTLHKFSNALKCHYCGYHTKIPETCPDCGSAQLQLKGFGTEKIEEEIQIFFPDVKIARLDADTARSRQRMDQILEAFDSGDLQILVGTQMITKGLDFENVGLVGVLNADQSLHFPDFRASERTFQLITQVGGRSGRRAKQGLVVIQAHQVGHPVIQEIMNGDFDTHIKRELAERSKFSYPPLVRLIQIVVKHKDPKISEKAAAILAQGFKSQLGERVLGPAPASIPRVNNYYIHHILLKMEKSSIALNEAKKLIVKGINYISKSPGMSTVRIQVDVDPN